MTNKIVCNAKDLTAIADAVRASNGSTNTYNVPELSAAAVNAIGNGGANNSDSEVFVMDGDGYVFGLLQEEADRFIQAAKDGKLLQVYLRIKTDTRLMIDHAMIVEVVFDGNGNFSGATLINGMGVQMYSQFEGNTLIFIAP